jgi:glycosyltransferase involved in cell wall biosynthesis
MACGTPVVAARRGALPETVGEAGLLADPDNPEEFTAAVLAAASDEGARAELVEKGHRRAAVHSWDRTAAMTDQTISELLSEGSYPGRKVLE